MPRPESRSGVSAVVLAAGMSTRMGSPKQLLRLGEKTLLETVLDNLRASQVDELVVVLGGSAQLIQQQINLDDARVVINEAYQQGMGTSLHAGVSAVDSSSDAALIALADQPFVRPGTIDHLIDCYRAQRRPAVIPIYKGHRGNPILLDRSLFPEVMTLSGDMGFRSILGRHTEKILKVPVGDVGVLIDVDTEADLQKFQQAYVQGTLSLELLEGGGGC
ncbi:MAG: nucleotidyltransferase family protein [Bryobacteraceae bacterium]